MSPNILFPDANPQDFFAEPVLEATHFDPGYSGHATDVWRVRTPTRTVALRLFQAAPWDGPFWGGLQAIFGAAMPTPAVVAARNAFLTQAGGLPAPRVLGSGLRGELNFLVMEWMPGARCETFAALSPTGLEAYGEYIARLHNQALERHGPLPLIDAGGGSFPDSLAAGLEYLLTAWYPDRRDLADVLPAMLAEARTLVPTSYAPVMVDIGASQYLAGEDGRLCALVDTDAYISAPPEMDLVNLEYQLGPAEADHFARGYSRSRPFPNLRPLRRFYRLLSLFLEVEGTPPVDEWLAHPPLFDRMV